MCGIVGVISQKPDFKVDSFLLEAMRDTMYHRGPDGAGLWIAENEKIGLAHRRLSIIDLSVQASQPMCNENGRIWVVFNGEIYNHEEIRKELSLSGRHTWKTDHSDTEVIIHAYEEWGIDFISKLRGQFAIGIWDEIKQDLYLIRDRAGIKPIYYTSFDDKLIFASEIKAILKDPSVKRQVNEKAFYNYLSLLTTPAPLTLFENIYKIPAGAYLKFSANNTICVTLYYDLLDYVKPLNIFTEEEISVMLIEKLRDSVKSHSVSDVPVGIFLSGGIDSSTNAALFSEGKQNEVKTFTIGYDKAYDSYKSEIPFAKMMAKSIGAIYFEKLLSVDDLLDFLPTMIRLQDEPLADPVCIPLYYVSKLAKDSHVTVCQVGEGADELFCGYASWSSALKINSVLSKLPMWVKRITYRYLKMTKFRDSAKVEFLRRDILGQPIFWSGAEHPSDAVTMKIVSKRLKYKFRNYSSWDAIKPHYENFKKKAADQSFLNWMSYIDLKLRLPELLLMRVDKMSMGASVETRVPFLDHKLVEFSMSIPVEYKLKSKESKSILKKAVRGFIPDELIDRKKQGFGIPVNEWLNEKLGEKIKSDTLAFLDKTDFFDKIAIMKVLEKRDSFSWLIYNFILWYNEYIDESSSNNITMSHAYALETGWDLPV
jgi:asparagine synthase (glutamine-hydrolysing)